jgi:hypothetical protein
MAARDATQTPTQLIPRALSRALTYKQPTNKRHPLKCAQSLSSAGATLVAALLAPFQFAPQPRALSLTLNSTQRSSPRTRKLQQIKKLNPMNTTTPLSRAALINWHSSPYSLSAVAARLFFGLCCRKCQQLTLTRFLTAHAEVIKKRRGVIKVSDK